MVFSYLCFIIIRGMYVYLPMYMKVKFLYVVCGIIVAALPHAPPAAPHMGHI